MKVPNVYGGKKLDYIQWGKKIYSIKLNLDGNTTYFDC